MRISPGCNGAKTSLRLLSVFSSRISPIPVLFSVFCTVRDSLIRFCVALRDKSLFCELAILAEPLTAGKRSGNVVANQFPGQHVNQALAKQFIFLHTVKIGPFTR